MSNDIAYIERLEQSDPFDQHPLIGGEGYTLHVLDPETDEYVTRTVAHPRRSACREPLEQLLEAYGYDVEQVLPADVSLRTIERR